MPENYQLRGNRVLPLSYDEIEMAALTAAHSFKFTKRNRKNIDFLFDLLFERGIVINPVEDERWLFVTKGHCDPATRTITVPNSIYIDACNGDRDALAVMFHEMGHLFLGHVAVLHYSNADASKEEDAEWQADTFAEVMLQSMGYRTDQMSFDFYI